MGFGPSTFACVAQLAERQISNLEVVGSRPVTCSIKRSFELGTVKYKCIKSWARTRAGQVVFDWELAKFPKEIQQRCFERIEIPVSVVKEQPKAVAVKKEDPSWQVESDMKQPTTKKTSYKELKKK